MTAAPESVLRAGERFGDLTLDREIGRGAQGVVFAGRQISVDRPVAVKVLPKEAAFTQEQVDRFHLEAEAAGRLNHPNIVAVYGLEEHHGHHLLMQEFVSGGDLEDFCEQRAQDGSKTDAQHCDWSAGIVRQLADALHHAHAHNVIHRDIKPANVLLTEEGVPKISDFGLARMEDKLGLSRTGAIMGTPHYMSPEQVQAKADEIDGRTDVYSLGATLYRLLTARVPFAADSMQAMFLDILTRAPKPLRKLQPGVHADLEAVCLKALAKTPSERYASAGEMAEDLQRYLNGESTIARPLSAVGRAARAARTLATSTLAAVVLLVPTAWFAIDFWLQSRARTDAGVHDVRLGLIALATLALAWPLGLLGVRLAKARRWGALPAWGLALLLGVVGAYWIREQQTDQLHGQDRDVLVARLGVERLGDNIGVADLEQYVAHWEPRFDAEDGVLMARAYLERQRPTQAEEWTRRAEERAREAGDDQLDSPAYHAVLAAIETTLGRDERARAATARFEALAEGASWSDWQLVGDIHRDLERNAAARDAYRRAGARPDADRDRLNLKLAETSIDLCEWEAAASYLEDFLKWHPEDPDANLVRAKLFQSVGDLHSADAALAIADHASHLQTAVLRARESLLTQMAREDELRDHVRRSFDPSAPDPTVMAWSGDAALGLGRRAEASVRALASQGLGDEAGAAQAEAIGWFEYALDVFTQLTQTNEAFLGHIGRSATLYKLAPYDPARAAERYAQSADAGRQAIALDDRYWQAHFNLGLALRRQLITERGGEDALTVDDVETYLQPMEDALALNGLEISLLNDAAHGSLLLCTRGAGDEPLQQALGYMDRAIRLAETRTEGACTQGAARRAVLSSCYTTQRELHELAGDIPAALVSAEAARDALQPGDPRWDRRLAAIERLRTELGD